MENLFDCGGSSLGRMRPKLSALSLFLFCPPSDCLVTKQHLLKTVGVEQAAIEWMNEGMKTACMVYPSLGNDIPNLVSNVDSI